MFNLILSILWILSNVLPYLNLIIFWVLIITFISLREAHSFRISFVTDISECPTGTCVILLVTHCLDSIKRWNIFMHVIGSRNGRWDTREICVDSKMKFRIPFHTSTDTSHKCLTKNIVSQLSLSEGWVRESISCHWQAVQFCGFFFI